MNQSESEKEPESDLQLELMRPVMIPFWAGQVSDLFGGGLVGQCSF